jgi:hypothetical protein
MVLIELREAIGIAKIAVIAKNEVTDQVLKPSFICDQGQGMPA